MRNASILAKNSVDSGQWLSYEIYLAWIEEQQEPQSYDVPQDQETQDQDDATVRPGK